MRRLAFALALFATSAAAATYDFERPISPLRSGPATPWQGQVHGASDGTDFLITWSDSRSCYPANVGLGPRVAMAQRVDAHGRVLATTSIPIAGTTLWTGSTYLVAAGDGYVRVSREGVLLDDTPRPFPTKYVYAIGSSGTHILAVTLTPPSTLSATLFDDTMFPLGSVQLATDADNSANIGVAGNGNGFAVFYAARDAQQRLTRVRAAVVDSNAKLVRNFDVMQLQWGVGPMKAASDGANFLVVVNTWKPNAYGEMSLAAATVDHNTALVSIANDFTNLLILGKNWIDGTEWGLTATADGYQLVSSRYEGRDLTVSLIPMTTLGAPYAPASLFLPNPSPRQYALLANAQGNSILLWSHGVSGGTAAAPQEVFAGETFDNPGDFAAHQNVSFRLGDGAFAQETPSAAVARDGIALVAWRERLDATGRLALYATRLAPDGSILDASSIRLADATTDGTRPAVVSDGRDFVVAWSEPERIAIRRVGSDGHLEAAQYVFTGPTNRTSSPALASNGSGYLLAYNNRAYDATTAIATWTTQLVRLDATATPVGLPTAMNASLMEGPNPDKQWTYAYAGAPLIASDGRDFLVLYTRQSNEPPPNSRTFTNTAVTRVSAAGTLTSADAPLVLRAPATLFWSGTTYVALDPAYGGFYGVRITADGLPLDGLPGAGPESSGKMLPGYPTDPAPQPLCDASGCWAAGALARDGTLHLYTWRVTDAAGAFDRSEPALAANAPTLAGNGSGAIVLPGTSPRLVYSRIAPEALNVTRVFVRTARVRRHAAR